MFRSEFLEKIILISTPLEERIAVAFCRSELYGICLLFAGVGDDVWSLGPNLPPYLGCLDDVIYNAADDKLYTLAGSGDVFVLQYKNHMLEVVSMVSRPIGYEDYHMFTGLLFFSRGDLFLVNKYSRNYPSKTFGDTMFKIFRLDRRCHNCHGSEIHVIENACHVCPSASCWAHVDDLGDQSLFIGPNNCFVLHEVGERKRNKIFFIYNPPSKLRTYSINQFGVFDLGRNKVEYVLPFELHAVPSPVLFFPEPKLWD